MPLNKKTTAHFALLFTNLFFAINLSAAKHLTSLQLAKPFGLNVVRVGVSAILFWILYLLKPTSVKIEKEDRMRFVWCALTGIAINQLLFIKGLSLTYSIHASLLMLTTPILITQVMLLQLPMANKPLQPKRLLWIRWRTLRVLVLFTGKHQVWELLKCRHWRR